MKIELFGAWEISVGRLDTFPQHSFLIEDSDGSDGRYIPSRNEQLVVAVDGSRWTVSIEQKWLDREWTAQALQREMSYDEKKGIVVRIDSHRKHVGNWSGPYFPGLELLCVYKEPSAAIKTPDEPYDFSYPKSAKRRPRPLMPDRGKIGFGKRF